MSTNTKNQCYYNQDGINFNSITMVTIFLLDCDRSFCVLSTEGMFQRFSYVKKSEQKL